MNEVLSDKLNETLINLIDSTATAKEFIMSELPDVLHQLLMWKFVESIVLCILPTILTIILLWILYKIFSRLRKMLPLNKGNCDELFGTYDTVSVPSLMIGVIILIVGIIHIFILVNIDWLQIWIAPKIYLIEYAADLVK